MRLKHFLQQSLNKAYRYRGIVSIDRVITVAKSFQSIDLRKFNPCKGEDRSVSGTEATDGDSASRGARVVQEFSLWHMAGVFEEQAFLAAFAFPVVFVFEVVGVFVVFVAVTADLDVGAFVAVITFAVAGVFVVIIGEFVVVGVFVIIGVFVVVGATGRALGD